MTNTCTIKTEKCGFRCTGYEGGKIWKKLHNTINEIECDSCKDHGKKIMSGIHDHVSVGLGKKPFDANNFKKFVEEVNCNYKTCKKEGRCI